MRDAAPPPAAPRVRLSLHCVERCRERGIPRRIIVQVLHHPFARGDADAEGRRWAVAPALCGAPRTWRWVKVIYERPRPDLRRLVTAYSLERRPPGA